MRVAFFLLLACIVACSARKLHSIDPRYPPPPPNPLLVSDSDGNVYMGYYGDGHGSTGVLTNAWAYNYPLYGKSKGVSYGDVYGEHGGYLDVDQITTAGIYYADSTRYPNVLARQSTYGSATGDGTIYGKLYTHGETYASPYSTSAMNTVHGKVQSSGYGSVGAYGQATAG